MAKSHALKVFFFLMKRRCDICQGAAAQRRRQGESKVPVQRTLLPNEIIIFSHFEH